MLPLITRLELAFYSLERSYFLLSPLDFHKFQMPTLHLGVFVYSPWTIDCRSDYALIAAECRTSLRLGLHRFRLSSSFTYQVCSCYSRLSGILSYIGFDFSFLPGIPLTGMCFVIFLISTRLRLTLQDKLLDTEM